VVYPDDPRPELVVVIWEPEIRSRLARRANFRICSAAGVYHRLGGVAAIERSTAAGSRSIAMRQRGSGEKSGQSEQVHTVPSDVACDWGATRMTFESVIVPPSTL
jgi:hypothetical protein